MGLKVGLLQSTFQVQSHNKAFKSDSQRLAFFIPSLGFMFTLQCFRLGGCVSHTLMRRYVFVFNRPKRKL